MRTLPKIFSQRDPQWASQRLGTVDGTTLGQYGCYITCFSMLANYYGHSVTPASLDDLFTNNSWYAQGNLLTDDGLQKAFSDIQFQQVFDYANNPADLGKLRNLLDDPSVSVVLEVDFDHDPSDGIQTHFVVAVDCDGSNVTIADPWYGTLNNFTDHYGTNPSQTILKFVVYKGTPSSTTVAVDAKIFPQLVDKATKYDAIHAAGFETIADITKKITDLETQNEEYLKKIEEDGNLAGQLLDVSHQRDDYKGFLDTVSKLLDLPTPQDYTAVDLVGIEKGIEALQKPVEEQMKPLQDHALSLQKQLPSLEKKRTSKKDRNLIQKVIDFFKNLPI